MIELVVAVGLAVSISAMCSLFEAVLYSVPVGHIEALAESGRTSGRILKALRDRVDRPIAAILAVLIVLVILMHIRTLRKEHKARLSEAEIDHDIHDSQTR